MPRKYEWVCPREGCFKIINAYTEGGIKALSEQHVAQHMREDSEQKQAKHQMTQAIEVFTPKNYDILKINSVDFGFLKTRGIAIDEQIEFDPSGPKPTKDELRQSEWARILDNAWRPNGID